MFRVLLLSILTLSSSVNAIDVYKTPTPLNIDGKNSEIVWSMADWYNMTELMSGTLPKTTDFHGRYKLLWDENYLYLLAEITDDVLFDQHANPLHFYWDDDCLEVFIDEDASGGNHQFSFNAFAYHIALDNQVVDIASQRPNGDAEFVLLNNHITSRWQRSSQSPDKIYWELAIRIFDDKFSMKQYDHYQPTTLVKGKELGFMLAYCDNDGSKNREHFMGSTAITSINGDKNLGYITADVFDKIRLIEKSVNE